MKLTENQLRDIIKEHVKRIMTEDSFANDFNAAREKYLNRSLNAMWGMELKNSEGDWEYGNVTFDPNTMQMSCMGASVQVEDGDTIDSALEALYDELLNQGYTSE